MLPGRFRERAKFTNRNRLIVGVAPSIIGVFWSFLLVACASPPGADLNLLAFLDQPGITRSEVRRRLGEPCAAYEHDRIAAYRMNKSSAGYYVVTPTFGWRQVRYDLLVEFDEHELVVGHHLIEIR
jgi:hypothetical protein